MSKQRNKIELHLRKRHHVKLGLAPGTIAVDPAGAKPQIYVTAYGPDGLHEQKIDDLDQMTNLRNKWPTIWVHVQGLSDAEVIAKLGEMFSLHNLALEDVVNRNQHPKLETHQDHLYIVAHAVPQDGGLDFGQVNIFVGESFVITLQERKIDWDESVRNRLREGRTRIRKLGANYLSYALLDSIVDNYFPVLEMCGEKLDALEEEVLQSPAQEEISRIHEIQKEILALRRAIAPLKGMTNILSREEMPPIKE